ncbi:pyridoxamine 5'-phosphate oxidase family protein [Salarchaeum japonicum]|nr:pyridoxamine 5'-phosphate oxidase family protein [Salarchaeum japonicum]
MGTAELDATAIDDVLTERGTGTLSLATDDDAYAVPQSFGYDGDALYFQLIYDEDSEKMARIEATDVASFTAYSEAPPRSVLARGPIEAVSGDGESAATAAIAENAWLPTVNVIPERGFDELDSAYYRLRPRKLTGRSFGVGFDAPTA